MNNEDIIIDENFNENEKGLDLSHDLASLKKTIDAMLSIINSIDEKSNKKFNDIKEDFNARLEEEIEAKDKAIKDKDEAYEIIKDKDEAIRAKDAEIYNLRQELENLKQN